MRRITGILLAVCTALFMAVQTAFSAPAESGWEDRAQECFGYFMRQRGAEDFWDGLDSGATDWAAYCYARLYGADGAEEYAQSVERHVGELYSAGGFVRPTEYQRAAICITVTGGDPSLAARLGAFGCEILDRQGFNAYIWALIALNVTGIQPPEGAANTADTLTEYLIAHQHADGSFALMGDGGDVDITAAAVYALAGTDSPGAAEAAQRGADWLAGFDSYSTMGVRNCESTAQAVMALSAAGRKESAEKAAAQLEEYRREGGGYAHLPDGEVNQMATAQTLEAFTALALAERGGSLFGKYSGAAAEPDGAESTAESAEIPTLTAESTAESGIHYARPSAAAAVESVAIRQSGSSPSTSRNSAWSSSPSTAANVHAPLPYPNEAIALFSAARLRSLRALPLATHTSAKRAPSRCSSNSSHASSRATSYMLPFADFFTRSLAVEIGSPYNRNDSKKRPPRHGRCGGITIGECVCARTESTQGNSSR